MEKIPEKYQVVYDEIRDLLRFHSSRNSELRQIGIFKQQTFLLKSQLNVDLYFTFSDDFASDNNYDDIIMKNRFQSLILTENAIKTIKELFDPLIEELQILKESEKIEEWINRRIKGTLSQHVSQEYKISRNKVTIIKYLIRDIIFMAYLNKTFPYLDIITQYDVLKTVSHNATLKCIFRETIHPFPYVIKLNDPTKQRFLISKEFISEFDVLSPESQYNVAITLVNYYKTTSDTIIQNLTEKIRKRIGDTFQLSRFPLKALQQQVLRNIVSYGQALIPDKEINFMILLHATLSNPYLDDIPIIEIFSQDLNDNQ
jgi:hypothetical protein